MKKTRHYIVYLALILFSIFSGFSIFAKTQNLPKIKHLALSLNGPFGPLGPFATNGPLQKENSQSIADWVNLLENSCLQIPWCSLNQDNSNFDPFGSLGPLGSIGPLNQALIQMARVTLGENSVESIFGPYGPMGVLGPLGPLGPIGGQSKKKSLKVHRTHGYYYNSKTKNKVSSVKVQNNQYPLFEFYSKNHALHLSQLSELDTSFMVDLETSDDTKLQIKSDQAQVLYIIAVPLANYPLLTVLTPAPFNPALQVLPPTIEVKTSQDQVFSSSERYEVNYLRIKVDAKDSLSIQVKEAKDPIFLQTPAKKYRLIVVGSRVQFASVSAID